jgi:hypothetical protein
MIVDKIRAEEARGCRRLAARVRFERGTREEHDVWVEVPESGLALTPSADVFLAAALLPAMRGEERLLIEGEVCPRLLGSCAQIQDLFAAWVPGARPVAIECAVRSGRALAPNRGVGSFFSAGVDSFHTLLKNVETITHLILIDGFDKKLIGSESLRREARAAAERVASGLGKQLWVVASNARVFVPTVVPWGGYHGAVLASVALALAGSLHTVRIPASYTYHQLQPWGSHPLLDPLWSTRELRIVHDGAEATRTQKLLDWICHSELALENLRVCLAPGDAYNCGRCEKCVRTMIPLELAGKLASSPVFPGQPSPRDIAQHRYTLPGQFQFAEETIALLARETGARAAALREALEAAVRRSRRQRARRERKLAKRPATWRDVLRELADL